MENILLNRVEQFKEAQERLLRTEVKIEVEEGEKICEGSIRINDYIKHIETLSVRSLRILRNEIYREVKQCEALLEMYKKNKTPYYLLKRLETRRIILAKYRKAIQAELKSRLKAN
jgi:hypothetical protein